MGQFLNSLIPWGTEAIVWVQSFRNGFFDVFFQGVTFLGEEDFYLLFLPLIYWCVDKRVGIGLAYISLSSVYLNSAAKLIFRIPRPSDPRIAAWRAASDHSFPSGHAQNAVANWGYLATQFRHRVFVALAALLIVLITLSRIYLGVHYPQDLVGGLLVGAVLLAAYNWLATAIGHRLAVLPLVAKLALSLTVPLALFFLHPADIKGVYPAKMAATTMGTTLGMSVGVTLEGQYVKFTISGSWWRRALRFVLGMAVVVVFYLGLKALFPTGVTYSVAIALRTLRYGLVGLAIAFLVPWLFAKIGI